MSITASSAPNRNPGIVPPWLRDTYSILPIEEQFTILPVEDEITILPVLGGETQFVRESVTVSPMSLTDALRAR